MEEMVLDESETVIRSTDNYSLKVRINLLKDVQDVCRYKTMKLRRYNQIFKFRFCVSVFPNGFDEKTEGWLVVLLDVSVPKDKRLPQEYGILSSTISIIDNDGNFRFPRSFGPTYSDRFPKYLERSSILNRKDEFLSEGVLTLRCHIHFYFDTIFSDGLANRILTCTIPWKLYYNNETDPLDPYDFKKRDFSDSFKVFDFTKQILTLPDCHESRRRFGIYGVSSVRKYGISTVSSCSSDSEDGSADIFEHVWIFDTQSDRFLVSLDERQDGVGPRLLKASPFIRRCVSSPMKEREEKRLHFPDVSTLAFITVLFFLKNGILPTSANVDYLRVYEFSHFSEMEALQRKCAEEMGKSVEFSTDELKRIADNYSDGYLSEMLALRWRDYEDSGKPIFRIHKRLSYESYI